MFRVSVIAATAIAAVLQLSTLAQAANVDAIQLDAVALDSTLSCGRTFFRSSSHYHNTIFMLPEVVASGGMEYKRTFEIIPSTDGKYILNLRLYFPERGDELVSDEASTFEAQPVDCTNTDLVKAALNAHIANESERVQTIALLPLTSIKVSIDGFEKPATIGANPEDPTKEVDILSYRNRTLTAVFKEITREQADYFYQRVSSPDGISAKVRLRFQGKGRDGSVKAQLNVDAVSAAFAAAVKGKASQILSKAEAQGSLRAAMDSRSLIVTTELGKTDMTTWTEKLTTQFLTDMDAAIEAVPANKAETTDPDGGGVISVAAVLDVIKQQQNKTAEIDVVGAPETATAELPMRIRVTSAQAINTENIDLRADYLMPSTGMYLHAGETMTITPVSWKLLKYDYTNLPKVENYMTSSDVVTRYNLVPKFDILRDQVVSLKDEPLVQIDSDKDGSRPVAAVGTYSGPQNWMTGGRYRWIHIQSPSDGGRPNPMGNGVPISSNIIPRDIDAVKSLPAGLSFSLVNGQSTFTFRDILTQNDYWIGRYDAFTGRIFLTAKVDLGLVQLRETMREIPVGNSHSAKDEVGDSGPWHDGNQDVIYKNEVVLEQVALEYQSYWSSNSRVATVDLRVDKHAIVQQRLINFAITAPERTAEGAPYYKEKKGPSISGPQADPQNLSSPAPGPASPVLNGPAN
jgi:hypothetical protein